MVRKELNKLSPLRIFEQSTRGGLGVGNIGIITAKKGVGKTACLVHIATDKLFSGRQVIHVSFAADTCHIVSWYEDIFSEIARRFNLDSAMEVHQEIIKHRIIMNFNQEGIQLSRVLKSVESMVRDGNFSADTIIVDGYDFTKITAEQLSEVKKFAESYNLAIWFSVTLNEGKKEKVYDQQGMPLLLKGLTEEVAIIVCLIPEQDHIRLKLVKDHDSLVLDDLHLKLDTRTLLIVRENS